MRAPEDAVPVPELGAAARLVRFLVAAIVVLASAVTGYVGSRIWPLPTFSGSMMHLAAEDNTSSTEPELREGAPLLSSQVSKSAAATDPSAPFDDSSQSVVAGAARLRETARIEVEGSSTGSPDSAVAVLYRSPAGQAYVDGGSAPATITGSTRSEHTAAARRWAPSAKASRAVRGQSTSGAGPAVVEFAPNPKPNQASRRLHGAPIEPLAPTTIRSGRHPANRTDLWYMVRSRGLEPPRLAALTPQASASTNSATTARAMGARTSSKRRRREQAARTRQRRTGRGRLSLASP